MPMEFSGLLRRLLTDRRHIYFALKVLLAILGLLAFTLATGNIQLTVLLSLGVLAGAIAETDDSLCGRLKNLVMTLICFASLCVQYLYPTPWLFAIGLASSTFIFVMVGRSVPATPPSVLARC